MLPSTTMLFSFARFAKDKEEKLMSNRKERERIPKFRREIFATTMMIEEECHPGTTQPDF